jgi:hypothetical protein
MKRVPWSGAPSRRSRAVIVAPAVVLALLAWSGEPEYAADDARLRTEAAVVLLDGRPVSGALVSEGDGVQLAKRTMYRDGVRHGVARSWYENGQLAYERRFREGTEVGTHRGWYYDGQLKFDYRFRDGVLEGIARDWFADGTLYKDFRYEHGYESGAQRVWYVDGTVRANYVVRNGRRYGLIGAKGCVSGSLGGVAS